MAKTELAVAELIWNMIARKTGNVGKVDFFPQKPAFPFGEGFPGREEEEQPLERAVPETQGISSARIAAFLKDLALHESIDIHQIMLVRNGKVICECGFAPYPAGMWHASYSMCKSITGMAVGILIAEGKLKLGDKVIDVFHTRKNLLNIFRLKDVTVENLLNMTSCVSFNETGIVSGNDWVGGYLESGLAGVPGRDFEYNSMNTYMLSAMVTEITGESLMEYLRPRLWEPMGIRRIFWETCPKGITKGGWGLFICPEDAAKLGMLYLQNGNWKGEQLVPEEWVRTSSTLHMETPPEMSNHGYGYQMWMGGREGSFNYNGMLGQDVLAYRDLNMVVVTNAGSKELFQNCVLLSIVKKYFEGDYNPPSRLPDDLRSQIMLQHVIEELEGRRTGLPVIEKGGWEKRKAVYIRSTLRQNRIHYLDGKTYEMEEKHVGLMPLMMQVFHNNFTDGIGKIGFTAAGNRLFIHLFEGEEELSLEIGFVKAAATNVSFHGDIYRLGVKGEFSTDEDGRMVLKIDFAFLEEACRRKVKLYFDDDMLEAHWDETPGKEVIMEGLDSLTDMGGRMGFLLNTIKESGGIDVFHILVERTVQPVCVGRLIDLSAAAEAEEEKGAETEAERETEKEAETQDGQDVVQEALQKTPQDAVQDTPQKAVHKFVGDAAQKIVQNIVGGAVQKTVQNIVEDIAQNAGQHTGKRTEQGTEQDMEQDTEQDTAQDAKQDTEQNIAQDTKQDTEQDTAENIPGENESIQDSALKAAQNALTGEHKK